MWLLVAIGVLAVLCGGVDAGDSRRSRSSSGKRSRSGSRTKEAQMTKFYAWNKVGNSLTGIIREASSGDDTEEPLKLNSVEIFNTKEGVAVARKGVNFEDLAKEMQEAVGDCRDRGEVDRAAPLSTPGRNYRFGFAVGLSVSHGNSDQRRRDVEDGGDEKPVYEWRKTSFGIILKPKTISFLDMRWSIMGVSGSVEKPLNMLPDFTQPDPKEIAWLYVYLPKKLLRRESQRSLRKTVWKRIDDSANAILREEGQKSLTVDSVEIFNTIAGVVIARKGVDFDAVAKEMRETVINCKDKNVDYQYSYYPPGAGYELAYAVGLGKTHGDAGRRKRDVEDAGDEKPTYGWRSTSFGFILKPMYIGFEEMRWTIKDVARSRTELNLSGVPDFNDQEPNEVAWLYVYVPKK